MFQKLEQTNRPHEGKLEAGFDMPDKARDGLRAKLMHDQRVGGHKALARDGTPGSAKQHEAVETVLTKIVQRAGQKIKGTGFRPDDFSETFYLRVADAYLDKEKDEVEKIMSKTNSMAH